MNPTQGPPTDKNNNANFYYCQFFNNCQHFVINGQQDGKSQGNSGPNQYNNQAPMITTPQLAVQDANIPMQPNNDSQGEATVNKIEKAPQENSFASHINPSSSIANIPQTLGPMSINSIQKPSDAALLDEKKNQSIFNNMLINKMSAYDFKQALQIGEMSTNSLLQNKSLIEKKNN